MKKILLVLTMALCLLGLTACGEKKSKESLFDEETCKQNAEGIVTQVLQTMDDEAMQKYIDMSTDDLNTLMNTSGMPMTGKAFRSVLEAWQSAKKEGGEFQSFGKWESSVSGEEFHLTTTATYEKRKAEFTVIFDKNSKISTMGIDMKYSMGEILKKAAMNTLLGMGTVFVVLILISFIISCFGLIGKAQGKKAKSAPVEPVVAPTVTEAAGAAEDVSDDLELAAVIAAAVAASSGASTDSFVVRSIKKRNANKWKKA